MMRQVSESLAGRASYLTLRPMTRREQRGEGRGGLWETLLATPTVNGSICWRPSPTNPRTGVLSRCAAAFRPRPSSCAKSVIVPSGSTATCVACLERDLQALASISALPDFRRLMRATCLRLGQIVNQTELGRDVALLQATVHRWLNLLETSYLLVRLPAYAVNRTKRLIKAPKLYWGDTGVALHVAGTIRWCDLLTHQAQQIVLQPCPALSPRLGTYPWQGSAPRRLPERPPVAPCQPRDG